MTPRLAAPVLTVDAGKMHQIDTRNVENLHSMWTVFNKCAETVEEGRRLENLSWRIWNRETFCCDSSTHDGDSIDRARLRPRQHSARDLPQLSSSVDSVASSDEYESRMTRSRQYSPPLTIHRLDSSRSSLSGLGSSARERHISSFALERMVMSIKEGKNPKEALPAHVVDAIPATIPSAPSAGFTSTSPAPRSVPAATGPAVASSSTARRCGDLRSSRSSDSTAPLSSTSSRGSRRMDSDTSADSMTISTHNVVCGFTPGKVSSYRSSPMVSAPIPTKSLASDGKKKGMFLFASSKSSGEEESSLERSMKHGRVVMPQKSSLTSQLKKSPDGPKKTTSFKDVVQERTFADEDVFEDSDEDEEDENAAIEDDSDVIDEEEEEDDAEWESGSDSEDDEEKPTAFPRVDSKVNLVSRKSLLTTMMHESDRASAMQNMAQQLQASKSQPQLPRGGRTRMTSALSKVSNGANGASGSDETGSAPKPIMSPSASSAALALSPRTTRRNMLGAELTESLRTHLLHERAMKNRTMTASKKGIFRRHTAQGDLSQLKQYPRGSIYDANRDSDDDEEEEIQAPWQTGIFGQGAIGEYHERGW